MITIIELKAVILWFIILLILYASTKIQFWLSNTHLNWEYFKKEVSATGILFIFFRIAGIVGIAFYLLIRFLQWYFIKL